jgi:hypothetical protein
MKLPLKLAIAGLTVLGLTLMLTSGDRLEAQGKANHKHLDLAIKKLKEAEKALFDAGAKESKQKSLEPGVLSELTYALRAVQNAYNHAVNARDLDNPKTK